MVPAIAGLPGVLDAVQRRFAGQRRRAFILTVRQSRYPKPSCPSGVKFVYLAVGSQTRRDRGSRGATTPPTACANTARKEANLGYWPKMSPLSFSYSGVSAVTRGVSTSRMNVCFDSPERVSFNWLLAA